MRRLNILKKTYRCVNYLLVYGDLTIRLMYMSARPLQTIYISIPTLMGVPSGWAEGAVAHPEILAIFLPIILVLRLQQTRTILMCVASYERRKFQKKL
jgi:hypothetical protein